MEAHSSLAQIRSRHGELLYQFATRFQAIHDLLPTGDQLSRQIGTNIAWMLRPQHVQQTQRLPTTQPPPRCTNHWTLHPTTQSLL